MKRWPSWWKRGSRSYSQSIDSITWWSTLIVTIWRGRRELSHLILRSRIKRKLSRSAMTAHSVKTKSERLLRTRAKTKMSWRCVTLSTFKWPGPIISKSAWTEKWSTILKLNKPFKKCALVLEIPMLKKWWWSSWLVSKLTPSYFSLSVITRRSMKSWNKKTKKSVPTCKRFFCKTTIEKSARSILGKKPASRRTLLPSMLKTMKKWLSMRSYS